MESSFFLACFAAGASALFTAPRLVCAAPPPPAGAKMPAANYHEIARYLVGGEGGWDYLTCDSPGHRIFITRGSHIQVVSTTTGKLIGDIPGTKGCHGVALAPDLGRGFVSCGADNSVTIFDFKTLQILGTVAVGQRPDAILYDPATHRVFTFNAGSSDSTALDAASGKVVGTIALGGKPEFAVSDPSAGRVFVNIEDKSELLTLDPRALSVLSRTALAPAEEPSGLALDVKRHLLFAACANQHAAVVDSRTGKLLATPPIGNGPDAAVSDLAKNLAFTSNGEDGTLSVLEPGLDTATYRVETIKTARGARTMTLDPATHRIYLATSQFEAVAPGETGRPRRVPGSFVVLVYGP